MTIATDWLRPLLNEANDAGHHYFIFAMERGFMDMIEGAEEVYYVAGMRHIPNAADFAEVAIRLRDEEEFGMTDKTYDVDYELIAISYEDLTNG